MKKFFQASYSTCYTYRVFSSISYHSEPLSSSKWVKLLC